MSKVIHIVLCVFTVSPSPSTFPARQKWQQSRWNPLNKKLLSKTLEEILKRLDKLEKSSVDTGVQWNKQKKSSQVLVSLDQLDLMSIWDRFSFFMFYATKLCSRQNKALNSNTVSNTKCYFHIILMFVKTGNLMKGILCWLTRTIYKNCCCKGKLKSLFPLLREQPRNDFRLFTHFFLPR